MIELALTVFFPCRGVLKKGQILCARVDIHRTSFAMLCSFRQVAVLTAVLVVVGQQAFASVDKEASPASPEHARWVMIHVESTGAAKILASREVDGHSSACSAAHMDPAHAAHYVLVRYQQTVNATCTVAVRDPRIRFYEQPDHDSHHHHSVNPGGTFALRVPLHVSTVVTVTPLHEAGDHHDHTSHMKETTIQLTDTERHAVRRTATELGNSVVTIPTTQIELERSSQVGDPKEQLNLIFISSGYQGSQRRGDFTRDVDEACAYLKGTNPPSDAISKAEPFSSYFSTFNIYRVWMSSDEAGASKPSMGVSVQNNLDCSYGPRIVSNLDCNMAKVLLAASYAPPDPQRSIIIVPVQDNIDGGSGGGNVAVYATSGAFDSKIPRRFETLLHQLGHAWGGSSDEYSYGTIEKARVPMKNCHYQSFNTPWQIYETAQLVRTARLGCTYDNYYGPLQDECVMRTTSSSGLCNVCQSWAMKAMYDNGNKLVSPTYPHLDEVVYTSPNTVVSLFINRDIPLVNRTTSPTKTFQFEVIWTIGTVEVGWQTSQYDFSSPNTGDYIVNVSIKDLNPLILNAERQTYERRGANGPTAVLQMYSFRITVTTAPLVSSLCTFKDYGPSNSRYLNTQYCGQCNTGATLCNSNYAAVATPRTSATVFTADLAGLEIWMVAVGIVFVVVGILIFIIAWRVMTVHQENSPVEILPLTENIMIVRGVLIGVQLLVLVIATFTIIYCVYQYGQLTVFGQSILLGVIACAVVVWLGSYIGVVAAYYKSRSLLFVNFILLLLLFGCVLLFSILLVYVLTNVNNAGVIDQLQSEWETAVANRPYAICDLQSYMGCSGFNHSCAAIARTSPSGSTTCPANCEYNKNSNPCLSYVQDFVKSHFGAASAGGWVLTALLLAALVLSVLLGCAIKNRRNVVHRERRVRHATGQNILLPEEIAMLRKEFNKIDRDGSGDISREEFSLFYNAVMGTDLSPRELEEYFDKLDADGNGNLSFEEFLKVYVPHREPRRKSMVKPKNVVEISTSSSSDEEEPDVAPQQPPPRSQQYEQPTRRFDDDFAFEAPTQQNRPVATPQVQGLNVSQQSRGARQGAYTPQAADLRTSYQSNSTRGGGGRAAAPPPRQDVGGSYSSRNTNGGMYANTNDLDLDIDMDDDFM